MGSLNVVKSLPNNQCVEADDVGRIPITEGKAEDATSKASFEIDASKNSVQEVRIAVPSNSCRMQDRGIPNQGKEAMDVPASNYPQSGLSSNEGTNTSPMQSSMLLSIMVFIAGITYTGLYNFSNNFPLDKKSDHVRTFRSSEIFFSPRSLPDGFWFLMATTFAFVLSMISILVAICSASGKWSFGVRAISLFVLSSLFISYMMMLERLVPHFIVINASGQILSGFEVLCLYTLIVILLLLAVALMARILWTLKHRYRMLSN